MKRGDLLSGVSRETSDRLKIYIDLLLGWQKRINLISSGTIDDLWRRHVEDSLECVRVANGRESWVDIGSGAGFPGLIAAICLADKGVGNVSLVESNGKKCAFLRTVVRETGLRESGVCVEIRNERAETALVDLPRPDVLSARALAPLDRLLEFGQDWLEKGTLGLFPKGEDYLTEIDKAAQNWVFAHNIEASATRPGSVIVLVTDVKRRSW